MHLTKFINKFAFAGQARFTRMTSNNSHTPYIIIFRNGGGFIPGQPGRNGVAGIVRGHDRDSQANRCQQEIVQGSLPERNPAVLCEYAEQSKVPGQ